MDGQLQYKDKHGRVWVVTALTDTSYERWGASTLDKGHTDDWYHVSPILDDLIAAIDQEDYLSASKPLTTVVTEEGAESVRPAPETIAEIAREAQATNRDDPLPTREEMRDSE
jgi:hypothetical protein